MNPASGIVLKILSTLAFTGMATLVKLISARYPVGEIAFARSLFAVVPVLVWTAFRGGLPTIFHTSRIGSHFLRTFIGVSGMYLGFAALARLPLADATAISYTAPLITVALAALLLHEAIHIYRWSAVIAGLVGVLIILSDYVGLQNGPERSTIGALMQLGGAACAGLATIQIRRLTRTEGAATIVIYFSLFSALILLLSLPFGWTMPSPADAGVLVLIGIFGGLGQVLMTQSFRYADASILAPFDYTSMLWALALSYLVFGDLPTVTMLAGSVLVIASGLFVIYRERSLRLAGLRGAAYPPAAPVG